MDRDSAGLTVFFEEPFWVGVFERIEDGKLSVAKVVFGSEPTDAQILEFVCEHYFELEFSPAVETVVKRETRNPKKRIRDAKKIQKNVGIGTKSQQALKQQQEQKKQERKTISKEQKLAEQKILFELKQQQKKEKHRGH